MQSAQLLKLRDSTIYILHSTRAHIYGMMILIYFPCTSYARCCFPLLYSSTILSTLGLQFFTTWADTLWKASAEMSQMLLKMKWEMQLSGPTKCIRVPQQDSSKQREDGNSINCQVCFSRNHYSKLGADTFNRALSGKSLIWGLGNSFYNQFYWCVIQWTALECCTDRFNPEVTIAGLSYTL